MTLTLTTSVRGKVTKKSQLEHEYSNLKLAEATVGRGLGVVKKSGRDEPIWVIIIHIGIETTRNLLI
jgi:hypothetical protein